MLRDGNDEQPDAQQRHRQPHYTNAMAILYAVYIYWVLYLHYLLTEP